MHNPKGEVISTFSKKKEANEFIKFLELTSDSTYEITKEVIPIGHDEADRIVSLLIKKIIKNTGATDSTVYLTGATNYRSEAATILPYKGSRKDAVKPEYYDYIRELLVSEYDAIMSDNCEADDLCAMALFSEFKVATKTKNKEDCKAIICTIDKDLRTVPGYHYHILREEVDWVSPKAARRFFAEQMLTGDSADSIPGISYLSGKKKLMGPKTAQKILAEADTTEELYEAIKATYEEFVGEGWYDKWSEVATLLWMQREPNQIFDLEDWKQGIYE